MSAGAFRSLADVTTANGCGSDDVVEDGAPQMNSTGVPETRQCLLRLEKCEILDTWYTTGLRGTGSNDVAVHDQFVPGDQSFSFQDPALAKRPGPLYAFPFMFAAKARRWRWA